MVQSHPGNRGHSERREVIALLLPDLVDYVADCEALRETLRTAPRGTRLLVCIPESPAQPLLNAMADLDVDKQFLLGHEVEKVETGAFAIKAPPGISRDNLVEFALALADVVLISARHENKQ